MKSPFLKFTSLIFACSAKIALVASSDGCFWNNTSGSCLAWSAYGGVLTSCSASADLLRSFVTRCTPLALPMRCCEWSMYSLVMRS